MSENIRKLFIASDHAGFTLKKVVLDYLSEENFEIVDLGTDSGKNSVDYPDYAAKLAGNLSGDDEFGILICGSGIGISIAANRQNHIRAALCTSEEMATLSRAHNNANVLCLGARLTDEKKALKIVDAFLDSSFESGRHLSRVEKLSK